MGQVEYSARWYASHKEEQKARVRESKKRLRKWVADYKHELGCSKCDEDDPVCLQFHHADDDKESSVSKAITDGWGIARLTREMEKCVVLCANCHFKEHRPA